MYPGQKTTRNAECNNEADLHKRDADVRHGNAMHTRKTVPCKRIDCASDLDARCGNMFNIQHMMLMHSLIFHRRIIQIKHLVFV